MTPFRQGTRPAFAATAAQLPLIRAKLVAAGYSPHHGPHIVRPNEIGTWIRRDGDRQIHVQEVRIDNGVAIYAHYEPAWQRPEHVISALAGWADYDTGARILCLQLSKV